MKSVRLLVLSLILSVYGYSQDAYVEIGANLSTYYIKDYGYKELLGNSLKLGYQVGLVCEADLSDRFSFVTGLYYITKGFVYSTESVLSSNGYTIGYLDLPIQVKYYFSNEKFRPFINLGGYLSTAVASNISLNDSDISRFDAGVIGGLGVNIQRFDLALRYTHGLVDISWMNNTDSHQGTYNSTFSLVLAYNLSK